ncbi:MAG: S-adenosylmethionine:tRNA ribosyltransferase-isomerase, partial [Acidobacteriota bacterium]
MRTADYEYTLPPGQVAQTARPRGTSRMVVLDRATGVTRFVPFASLAAFLGPGDVLLLNDVRVIPARLHAARWGGGRAELLLVRPLEGSTWEVLARPSKRLRPGEALRLGEGVAVPLALVGEGRWKVEFEPPLAVDLLERVGEVPLPPYIRRGQGATAADRLRYQTVYAGTGRAVAAPTAGLHFTPEALQAVADRGAEVVRTTLHVGPGTFKPVAAADPREHVLDPEDYEIPAAAAASLNRALAAGRRVTCVGTTSCRTLEHALRSGGGHIRSGPGRADLYVLPGHRFLGTGALLTNFHLPRST